MQNSCRGALALACGALVGAAVYAPLPANAAQKINVKSFGAVGDGTTDDSAALQAAFAAAGRGGGHGTVVFPPGNYLYSTRLIASGISVVGQQATLTSTGSAQLTVAGDYTTIQSMIFDTQGRNMTAIRVVNAIDFDVKKNSFTANLDRAVLVTTSKFGVIEQNQMTLGNVSHAVEIVGSLSVLVEKNTITGNGSNASALVFEGSTNINIAANKVTGVRFGASYESPVTFRCADNVFSNIGSRAISIRNGSGRMNIYRNRVISAGDTAIYVPGTSNMTISNNVLENCRNGMNFRGNSNIQVTGNDFSNIQQSAIEGDSVSNFTISGNRFKNDGNPIVTRGGANLSITDNRIAGSQQLAVYAVRGAGTQTISNNYIQNCGLAATDPAAVIFVNSPAAASIPITKNSYAGNTNNLQYFIWCVQAQPPAQVSGNKTNTLLPNRVGS